MSNPISYKMAQDLAARETYTLLFKLFESQRKWKSKNNQSDRDKIIRRTGKPAQWSPDFHKRLTEILTIFFQDPLVHSIKEESIPTIEITNAEILKGYMEKTKNQRENQNEKANKHIGQDVIFFDFCSHPSSFDDNIDTPFNTREIFEIINWVSPLFETKVKNDSKMSQANKSIHRLLIRDVQMRTLSHL